jgi:hypothetical protein
MTFVVARSAIARSRKGVHSFSRDRDCGLFIAECPLGERPVGWRDVGMADEMDRTTACVRTSDTVSASVTVVEYQGLIESLFR